MKLLPSFERFSELHKTGAQRIVVGLEMNGDLETPISLFARLRTSGGCFLLESVEGGERWSRYSYIGRNPLMEILGVDDAVRFVTPQGTETAAADPLPAIEERLAAFQPLAADSSLPYFTGGAVGYIGYDVVRTYEKLGPGRADELGMPNIHLLVTDELVAYDHVQQKIILMVTVSVGDAPKTAYEQAQQKLTRLQEEIERPWANTLSRTPVRSSPESLRYKSSETKDSFVNKVTQAKDYIRNGDIFQVVLSQRLEVETEADPFSTYRVLRSLNPSPYLFFVDFGPYQLVGSSPELLVKVADGQVETCPIAGTRRRGDSEQEDEQLAQELLADEKELAEHRMLVDLGRNDIGRVSAFGTVQCNDMMHIERFSHVMHIVSHVHGQLDSECTMFDALRACLPAGTLSGAPKVRAMEIIDELENVPRGPYAGAVGYFGFNGNMDFCITIRTIVFARRKAWIQAGAGIVADSQPDKEYEETLRKAQALMVALEQAEEAG